MRSPRSGFRRSPHPATRHPLCPRPPRLFDRLRAGSSTLRLLDSSTPYLDDLTHSGRPGLKPPCQVGHRLAQPPQGRSCSNVALAVDQGPPHRVRRLARPHRPPFPTAPRARSRLLVSKQTVPAHEHRTASAEGHCNPAGKPGLRALSRGSKRAGSLPPRLPEGRPSPTAASGPGRPGHRQA